MPKNRLPSPISDFVDISQDVEIFGEFKWLLQALPTPSVPTETDPAYWCSKKSISGPIS